MFSAVTPLCVLFKNKSLTSLAQPPQIAPAEWGTAQVWVTPRLKLQQRELRCDALGSLANACCICPLEHMAFTQRVEVFAAQPRWRRGRWWWWWWWQHARHEPPELRFDTDRRISLTLITALSDSKRSTACARTQHVDWNQPSVSVQRLLPPTPPTITSEWCCATLILFLVSRGRPGGSSVLLFECFWSGALEIILLSLVMFYCCADQLESQCGSPVVECIWFWPVGHMQLYFYSFTFAYFLPPICLNWL